VPTSQALVTGSRGCGCRAQPRWRCERCSAGGSEHLSCSRACLAQHLRREHPEATVETVGARTRRRQQSFNADNGASWESFADHRARVTGLLRTLQRGEGLCVLGAGNADDLDLPSLVREFGEVHLIDLDGAALERAHARLPVAVADRVSLHGDLDLTGLLDGIERWGEDDGTLAAEAAGTAATLAARLGRTFDVVLSSCVLSQLCAPFTRALARRAPEWTALMGLVGQVHFELMARLLRPGGTGVALADAYYGLPSAPRPQPSTWEALPRRTVEGLREGVLRLRDPAFLGALLAGPPVRQLVASARLSEPWFWRVENALMLVYAVVFQRA
jgi:hypothetical protein